MNYSFDSQFPKFIKQIPVGQLIVRSLDPKVVPIREITVLFFII